MTSATLARTALAGCGRTANDSVDTDYLAEDDTVSPFRNDVSSAAQPITALPRGSVRAPDKILCPDTRCSHSTSQYRSSSNEDTPIRMSTTHTHKRSRDISCEAQNRAKVNATHHPAPITLNPILRPTPVSAHACGLVSSRKVPTLKASPDPVLIVRSTACQLKAPSSCR